LKDDEFERLYSAEAQGLYAFLAYRTGDRALAEDLLADAFERALRGKFNPKKASAKTWLYSIALNVLRDHVRRVAAEGRAYARAEAGAASEGADPFAGVEVRDELLRALGGLAAEEREAIALRFGSDLTVPEMASVLGVPLTTVEGRVYRALRKLREALA
jgi:RNA polymerase sigma factor (sigma-70 family)